MNSICEKCGGFLNIDCTAPYCPVCNKPATITLNPVYSKIVINGVAYDPTEITAMQAENQRLTAELSAYRAVKLTPDDIGSLDSLMSEAIYQLYLAKICADENASLRADISAIREKIERGEMVSCPVPVGKIVYRIRNSGLISGVVQANELRFDNRTKEYYWLVYAHLQPYYDGARWLDAGTVYLTEESARTMLREGG